MFVIREGRSKPSELTSSEPISNPSFHSSDNLSLFLLHWLSKNISIDPLPRLLAQNLSQMMGQSAKVHDVSRSLLGCSWRFPVNAGGRQAGEISSGVVDCREWKEIAPRKQRSSTCRCSAITIKLHFVTTSTQSFHAWRRYVALLLIAAICTSNASWDGDQKRHIHVRAGK